VFLDVEIRYILAQLCVVTWCALVCDGHKPSQNHASRNPSPQPHPSKRPDSPQWRIGGSPLPPTCCECGVTRRASRAVLSLPPDMRGAPWPPSRYVYRVARRGQPSAPRVLGVWRRATRVGGNPWPPMRLVCVTGGVGSLFGQVFLATSKLS